MFSFRFITASMFAAPTIQAPPRIADLIAPRSLPTKKFIEPAGTCTPDHRTYDLRLSRRPSGHSSSSSSNLSSNLSSKLLSELPSKKDACSFGNVRRPNDLQVKSAGSVNRVLRSVVASFTLAGLLVACDNGTTISTEVPPPPAMSLGAFGVMSLSSPSDSVSGGAARLGIEAPDGTNASSVSIELNGADITDSFSPSEGPYLLTGRVEGLQIGANALRVYSTDQVIDEGTLTLTNYADTGPIFSGPQQMPFYCATDGHRAGLELGPIVDFANCSVERTVSFKYRTTGSAWADYDPAADRPEDMSTRILADGSEVDFVVRWERGTINRFLYSIAVPVAGSDQDGEPDLSVWNKRLVYYFQGGVAIGHYQGSPSQRRALYVDGLDAGYAIAYSTGTKTGTHYNLQVAGETAIMVKDRFVTAYGLPDYTVGVGGSGGGIQQYIYAQNHPGLIDAGVAQYSYPDMITQTIHIGDCELIERWIDMQLMLDPGSKWADWNNRTWLIGLNASPDVPNDIVNFGLTPWVPPGSSECTAAWRGLSPLALNPKFGTAPGITPEQQAEIEWTHFADLINIYGRAADGFANSTWDNVGVQYGLQALVDGNITPAEFLDLNASIGSWKEEAEMMQEGCPFLIELCGALDFTQPLYPDQIDPWSWRNANTGSVSDPAPRRLADPGAIDSAMSSGMVNMGKVEIPLIDWRHYLEGRLDMHNSHQSFAARQRLLNYDGDASNQLIWFVDPGEGELLDNTLDAFAVIDDWMANIVANPERSVGENRPAAAVDTCFAADGSIIGAGDGVWDGILNEEEAGICTERFPIFSTSRIVAGAPITGDVFKCPLQPVATAIDAGLYGAWSPSDEEVSLLERIFPAGVCDYSASDL